VIAHEELAAVAAALALLAAEPATEPTTRDAIQPSRWKVAARNPDFEIEELRAIH
jgi:hypothetical protein